MSRFLHKLTLIAVLIAFGLGSAKPALAFTWTVTTVDSGNTGGNSMVTVGDTIHAAYYTYNVAACTATLNHAYYNGTSWSTETLDTWVDCFVDNGIFDGSIRTGIDVDSSGNPHIVYTRYDMESDSSILTYKYVSAHNWFTVNSFGSMNNAQIEFPTIKIDSLDQPRIVYRDYFGSDDIRYLSKSGSNWSVSTIETGNNTGLFSTLALDESGEGENQPHVSFLKDSVLKYATRVNGSWSVETVESSARQKESTVLYLGGGAVGLAYIRPSGCGIDALTYAVRSSGSWSYNELACTFANAVSAVRGMQSGSSGGGTVVHFAWSTSQAPVKYGTWSNNTFTLEEVGTTIGSRPVLGLNSSSKREILFMNSNWPSVMGPLKFAISN